MISIITPVFNAESFLKEAIESVCSQSYTDWELILVDDGSTDSSGKLCDQAVEKNEKIKVVHKENGGLSSARNAGIDIATGEYITFLDADDLLNTDALQTFMNHQIDTEADIICGKTIKFKDKSSLNIPNVSYSNAKIYSSKDAIKTTLYQKNIDNSASNKLYSSKLWKNLRFREDTYYEDLDIFYQVFLKANKIANISEVVYLYRQHDSSYIHTFNLARKDMLSVTSRMTDYFDCHFPELSPAAHSRQLSANFNMFLQLAANNKRIESGEKEEADRIANQTWKKIKELRKECLKDPDVRFKNKVGILAGYLGGKKFLEVLGRLFY